MLRSCCTALAPPAEDNYDILSMALASEPLPEHVVAFLSNDIRPIKRDATNVAAPDVMPRKLGPTSGVMDDDSEEAGSPEGGASSGSEASCRVP